MQLGLPLRRRAPPDARLRREPQPARQARGNVRAAVRTQADEWLLAVGRSQDRAAFAALFRHYGPRIKSFLNARGASAGAADEVTQEIMLAVWRRAASFDPARGSASTWIFTVARNGFIDSLRRERRPELEPDDPALVPALVPAAESQEAAFVAGEDQRRLAEALGTLPPEQAGVLDQVYFHGRSLPEVAEDQKVPLGTVKTRVRLALQRLRGLLGSEAKSA